MTFLSSKKHPFEKITSPNDKTKVFFYRKVIYAQKILGIFYHMHEKTKS